MANYGYVHGRGQELHEFFEASRDGRMVTYRLETPYSVGVTMNDDGSILMIDPAGGPSMTIGDVFITGLDIIRSINLKDGKFYITTEGRDSSPE